MNSSDLLSLEPYIRLICFVAFFIGLLIAEYKIPWRYFLGSLSQQRRNICILVINTAFLRLLIPFASLGVAYYCENQQIGLFYLLSFGVFLSSLLSILLLDLLIYWQHRIVHIVPLFWRFHQIHHTDHILNTTSAVRFHPVEIILSMLVKLVFITILGVPVVAALIFEIILNTAALFSHSNIKIAKKWDARLRTFIVTPAMHRIHHSHIRSETNSNYGFFFSFWDRIFVSYTKIAKNTLYFGIERPQKELTLWTLILLPFKTIKQAKS